jgi:uncharacterized protein YjhX (UPF0386 family)
MIYDLDLRLSLRGGETKATVARLVKTKRATAAYEGSPYRIVNLSWLVFSNQSNIQGSLRMVAP